MPMPKRKSKRSSKADREAGRARRQFILQFGLTTYGAVLATCLSRFGWKDFPGRSAPRVIALQFHMTGGTATSRAVLTVEPARHA